MVQFRCLDSDLYVSGTYMVRWCSVEQENVSSFEGISLLPELANPRYPAQPIRESVPFLHSSQ